MYLIAVQLVIAQSATVSSVQVEQHANIAVMVSIYLLVLLHVIPVLPCLDVPIAHLPASVLFARQDLSLKLIIVVLFALKDAPLVL